MPEPLLTFFKYLFLAVLYLFFLRVLRAVWIELREPKVTAGDGPLPAPSAAAPAPRAAAPTTPIHANAGGRDHPPRLIVRTPGGHNGTVFDLHGETTVGRSPGCGVALPDDSFVSQIHARLYRRDGTAWVEDLGSTNGTFVNDQRLETPIALRPGDRLRVGQTEMELET